MDANVTENFVMPEGMEVEEEKKTVATAQSTDMITIDEEVEEFVAPERPVVKRPAFAYWDVGGKRYRLKLKTAGIQAIEHKYKKNMMMFLDTMPALSFMLEVVHEAMIPWHKGVKMNQIQALYDKYTEDGGDHISFWRDIFLEVYKASGFFTQEMLQNMAEASKEN